MKKSFEQSVCQSVFRSGESSITREQYTQVWIRLINQIEKSKEILAGVR